MQVDLPNHTDRQAGQLSGSPADRIAGYPVACLSSLKHQRCGGGTDGVPPLDQPFQQIGVRPGAAVLHEGVAERSRRTAARPGTGHRCNRFFHQLAGAAVLAKHAAVAGDPADLVLCVPAPAVVACAGNDGNSPARVSACHQPDNSVVNDLDRTRQPQRRNRLQGRFQLGWPVVASDAKTRACDLVRTNAR